MLFSLKWVAYKMMSFSSLLLCHTLLPFHLPPSTMGLYSRKASTFILSFPAPRTANKYMSVLYKLLSLWYSVSYSSTKWSKTDINCDSGVKCLQRYINNSETFQKKDCSRLHADYWGFKTERCFT